MLRTVLVVLLLLAGTATGAASPGIEISGGREEHRTNIRSHLSLDNEPCELASWRESVIINSARASADKAMRALGHYQARFDLRIEDGAACWTLVMALNPGPPVRIRERDIQLRGEAAEDPAFRELLESTPVREGAIARHDHYEQLKKGLTRLATRHGYFDSELTRARLEIDTRENTAAVRLTLDSGPRYHFGRVNARQDAIRDQLMQRFIPFDEGQPFDNRELLNLRQELNRSGYFTRVRIQAHPEQADPATRRVPVDIDAERRPRYEFLAGVGYATDTGPRMRLGLENRRVNKRGHSYQAEVEASQINTGAGFNYRIPLRDPNREYMNLYTSYMRDETDTSFSERYNLGVARVSELPSDWILTRSLEYLREFYTISDQRDRADLIMPGLALQHTSVDDPTNPRLGWHLDGEVRGASAELGSTVSFGQFHGHARGVIPAGAGRLLGRVELGATAANELVELPVSVRFFAGGDNSVRGYDYEELGPTNDDGEVVGGRHLLTGSIEYDYPVVGRWSLAVFTDAGNAFDSFREYEVFRSVGTGVRWRSPIGPIRVDVARPVEEPDNFRLHISMGSVL